MKLSQPGAALFVPDGVPDEAALARTTHLGIGAHPDDLELMTWHGLVACHPASDGWFAGVVVTDGAASPRSGPFAGTSDDEMRALRRDEQHRAATRGRYAAVASLGFTSQAVKSPSTPELQADLAVLLGATRPRVVYTHNLLDAHDTHLAVSLQVLRALRTLPDAARPDTVYGCEVWRGLDWLPARYRVVLDVSAGETLARELIAVYASQIEGGKRYDRAALGRRRANATYADPHHSDGATAVEHVMDLTPLVRAPELDVEKYLAAIFAELARDASERVRRLSS
jgi:LmbE family N-acetylglucosaminyl deacetylase